MDYYTAAELVITQERQSASIEQQETKLARLARVRDIFPMCKKKGVTDTAATPNTHPLPTVANTHETQETPEYISRLPLRLLLSLASPSSESQSFWQPLSWARASCPWRALRRSWLDLW